MLSHGAVTLVYDGDGNRVAETVGGSTTKYLVDTLNPTGYAQVMDELVSGAVTRTYTYGLQRISENQKIGATQTASFYGYDGHGNVRFLTGTAGTVTDAYVYDAFGLPLTSTGTTPNSFLYSGEQFDSVLGMYYLRARYYNPATGRFLAMDSDEGNAVDPATLNKYLYAKNNPVNTVDPTGHGAFAEFATELRAALPTFVYAARLGCYTVTASTLVFEFVGFAATGSFPNPGVPYWALAGPCAAVTVFFPPLPPA